MEIRERREVLGLTQPQLAKKIHVSNGTMSNIETGRSSQIPKTTYALLMRVLWGSDADDEVRFKAVIDKLVMLSPQQLGVVDATAEALLTEKK